MTTATVQITPDQIAMKEILDDATYTGDRYTYGFQNRPPGYPHNPNDFIHGTDAEHPHFRWGTLDFPRDLGADAARWELELVKIVLTTMKSWGAFQYRAGKIWANRHQNEVLTGYLLMEGDATGLEMDTLWIVNQSDVGTAGRQKIEWHLWPANTTPDPYRLF